ncbi:hypothetical protein E5676_scaffold1607G00240 [Cucumis melo var. makuwa]|uniref:Uncharacterized protein n=1 Tax=Cucumis melo var. makuwa TaxID=1194695 RepID=A0A5D3DJD1_CUCMM|nr:hypothetical protein E6C27_scaffold98G00860 [Cucumis melo var. makuwa]TYK23713.1 hypothetical protein E5676_scaffold1607G00240 [Cucumis melo var. makuwa]
MVNPPKSRKRKLKRSPQPPRPTKAKTIEVEEPDGLGYMVEQFLTGSGSGGSIPDHYPSSSSDDREDQYVPMGILSPTPISLPPVSPNAFTSTLLAPSSEEELSIYDYGGWEEAATGTVPYPILESSVIDPNNYNNGGLSNWNSSNLEPFVYPEPMSYSLPPIFKTPLPPLYYRPKIPKPN